MKISTLVASLFFASGALAGGNVPHTEADGTNTLSAEGSPCASESVKKQIANTLRHLTMKTWVDENKKYKDANSKSMLQEAGKWMQMSTYTILPQIYYKAISGPRVSVCSGRAFVNGQSVNIASEEKRNVLRYVVVGGKDAYLIDYNIEVVGPWTFKAPKRPVSH